MNNINILDILSDNKSIIKNMDMLEELYSEKLNAKVCRTCPSDINYMVSRLKNYFNMTNFKFKKHAAMYKNAKGDKTTISNNTMTDEKAIEFLKTNQERIKLFSEFPKNWKELIEGKAETEEQKNNRLAIEAEMAASNTGNDTNVSKLEGMKLSELRELYPTIKATSTKDFIEKVYAEGFEKVDEVDNELKEELSRMSLDNLKLTYPDITADTVVEFVELVLKA